MENTPVFFNSRLLLVANYRPSGGPDVKDKEIDSYLSPYNPILEAGEGEGINNSDVDLIEYEGRTYLYYATGDQATWATIRVAMYDGLMKTFYEKHFPQGSTFVKFSTKR